MVVRLNLIDYLYCLLFTSYLHPNPTFLVRTLFVNLLSTCRLGGKEVAPPKILGVETLAQSTGRTSVQSFPCHLCCEKMMKAGYIAQIYFTLQKNPTVRCKCGKDHIRPKLESC